MPAQRPASLPVSSTVQVVASAVLALGVLLLLVVSGGDDAQDEAGSEEASAPIQLSDGFTAIDREDFLATVARAQQQAGTWRTVSVSELDGTSTPPSVQQSRVDEDGTDTRVEIQGTFGPLVLLVVDGQPYVKGMTPKKTPWLRLSDERAEQVLAVAEAVADPARFDDAGEPTDFEVVGVEDVDGTLAVHYRLTVEPAPGAPPVEMDMWVDAGDRPVQAVSVSRSDEGTRRDTLLYSEYGAPVDIAVPPKGQVTTKAPEGLG